MIEKALIGRGKRAVVAVLCVALPFGATPLAAQEPDVEPLECQWLDEQAFKEGRVEINTAFDEGLSAYECGDYAAAHRRFEEIIAFVPANPHVNYYLAASKVALGRDRASRRFFERAIDAEPTFIDARVQLALVHVRLGADRKAAHQLEALKKLQQLCASGAACEEVRPRLDKSVELIEAALGS